MSCVWREDRRHVGRDEVLVVAEADHHRRTRARRHDLVRVRARNHRQREDAGQLLHRRAHGLLQVALEMLLHQVGDDLGVGLGLELVAFGLQLLL